MADSDNRVITIDYFSDLLCVWAYGGQVRLDTLQQTFGDRLRVRHRFVPLFADTATRIGAGWQDRGGFEGFGSHMGDVCAQWEHTAPDARVWTDCRPRSCTTAHVFLKAAALCLGVVDDAAAADGEITARYDRLVARTRTAFFEQARDIGELSVLLDLLEAGDPPPASVRAQIENGAAYAMLHRDEQLSREHGVLGSPTYVFNEGRQLLYGNVGYRIIESNVRELLSRPHVVGEPSWC